MSNTPTYTTESASSFLGGIGVNTHLRYTDGGYANVAKVISDLQYLGITQVRDQISNGSGGSAPISSYVALAKAGIQFTFNVNASSTAGLQSQLSMVNQVATTVPGSVIAVEGSNEINNFAVSYNGVSGLQGALNEQAALYSMVHSDADLPGVSVDYFTGYDAGSIGMGPDPLATGGLADADTQHPYPMNGQAPAFWVSRAQALPNTASASAPAVYTETGYTTDQVSPDVQAKYTLDLLLDTAKEGISKTYLYELMDAYAPGSPQGDAGYGLFDSTGAPKPVATAIHDLTTILADTGANASSFKATPLTYSIANLPTDGSSMAIEKSNGTYVIAVWAEPQIWNTSTKSEVAAPSETVTVTLPQAYTSEQVFDPLSGTSAIATYSGQTTISLSLTDHPLLIEVSGPVSPSGSTSTTSTSSGSGGGTTSSASSSSEPSVTVSAAMTSFTAHFDALPSEAAPWQIQGTMDYDGAATSELVYRNATSGQLMIFDNTSSGFTKASYSGGPSSAWSIAGLGDFNGDGKGDILWRNTATNQITEWTGTATGFTQSAFQTTVPSTSHVQGIGDFNGDGKDDVLWSTTAGVISEWQSTGSSFTHVSLGSMATSWHVAAIADFNGDGKSDIMWQNTTTGAITEWQSTGAGFTQNAFSASVAAGWTLIGAADFSGDGKADLVFENSSGAFDVWESTGTGFIAHVSAPLAVEQAYAQTVHHYDII